MTDKDQLLKQFNEWIHFVMRLAKLEESIWNQPIAEGKWSIREIVSHIMLWDKYFFEEAIIKICKREVLTVRHLDFDEFNEKAKKYSRRTYIQDLMKQSIYYREQIIDHIRILPEEQYYADYMDGDGKPFNISQYLKDFIWHDQHHMGQIQELVKVPVSTQEDPMKIKYHMTNSSKDESDYVRNRLIAFNAKHVPEPLSGNYREVNLSIKNESDRVIAGILSVICWNWLEVDILWVDENYRGSGYGSMLLKEVEEIAKQYGCTFIKLNTFSFQAPLFYLKHGYSEVAVIEDAPKGFNQYYYKKTFEVTR